MCYIHKINPNKKFYTLLLQLNQLHKLAIVDDKHLLNFDKLGSLN